MNTQRMNEHILEQVMKNNDSNPRIIDIVHNGYLYKLVLHQRTIVGYLNSDNQEIRFNNEYFYVEPFERIGSQ